MFPFTAKPNLIAKSIAFSLIVGKAPGNPREVGHVYEFSDLS